MNIVNFVKNNKLSFTIYFFVFSFFVNILKLFIKTDNRLILFVSFGGRYFNDNPKCIYDAMLADQRFKGYKLVWAFLHPEKVELSTPKINIMSLSYIITALKARCWVTNVAIERGLDFKGKNTFYLNTTHTSFPKTIEIDSRLTPYEVKNKCDCICAQSEKEKQVLMSGCHVDNGIVAITGYPKNDILCNYDAERRLKVRKRLGLNNNKTVILYAPTYRGEDFGAMKSPVDFKKWETILGHKYVVLFRAHPVVANETQIDSSTNFIFNVSDYPENVDLMIASDILISDYSGIFFEYAVQKKPMFCYAYDYDDYIKTRALNCDIRSLIPGGYMSEVELLNTIKDGHFEKYVPIWDSFRKEYVSEYGHATEKCLDIIYKAIR